MTFTALGLVLVAALAHATWNLLAKRAGTAGLAFVWCFAGMEVLVVAPLALWQLLSQDALSSVVLGAAVASGVLHTGYFLLLQRGYARGDLSLVYPVARGLGPLLAVAGAVVLLGEQPSALAYLGILAVCGGVLWLAALGGSVGQDGSSGQGRSGGAGVSIAGPVASGAGGRRSDGGVPGFGIAVLVGGSIAAYTLWDGYAMAGLGAPAVGYFWGASLTRYALLSGLVVWRRPPVRATWKRHRARAVAVGVLSPVSYILVLVAFGLAPISLVAPAREISIVVGTLFGIRLLGEAGASRRLAAAATIVAGVVVLGMA